MREWFQRWSKSFLTDPPLAPNRVFHYVNLPWIWLVAAHPTDDWSAWDLGNLEARSTPWALCHVPLAIPVQVLWCVRAYSLISGEEHCIGYSVHNVVWMGDVVPRPKLSLQSTKLWGNGQCYSHDLGVCRCITAATSIWFSESVHPSGWTGHNCITVRGITWSTLCSKGVTTQGN